MSDISKRNKGQDGAKAILFSALKSALIAYFIALFLCLLAAALTLRLQDPTATVLPISMIILYLSSFLAGFFCMRILKEKALLAALTSGGMLICLHLVSSLLLPQRDAFFPSFAISAALHALMIVFAFLGARAGKPKAKKRRSKK